jgi:hypothetical protein
MDPTSEIDAMESLVRRVVSEVLTQVVPLIQAKSAPPISPAQVPQPTQISTPPSKIPAVEGEQGLETGVSAAPAADQSKINSLQGQIDLMQLRQEKLQQQIRNYEAEIQQLHEEKQVLEQTLQELPDIYRQKLQLRLEPIRARIHQIQQENHQLRSEVVELSYRLSAQHPPEILDQFRWRVRLPQLPKVGRPPVAALPQPGSTR